MAAVLVFQNNETVSMDTKPILRKFNSFLMEHFFLLFFQEISKAAGHMSAYTLCCKLAPMTMLIIEIYYSTFIHLLVDLYRVTLVCYETISLTSLPRSNSRGVNSTHHCHYTMVSADSKFDDFVCSVFDLNYKNVNALIARILSGFTCNCSLTVNG